MDHLICSITRTPIYEGEQCLALAFTQNPYPYKSVKERHEALGTNGNNLYIDLLDDHSGLDSWFTHLNKYSLGNYDGWYWTTEEEYKYKQENHYIVNICKLFFCKEIVEYAKNKYIPEDYARITGNDYLGSVLKAKKSPEPVIRKMLVADNDYIISLPDEDIRLVYNLHFLYFESHSRNQPFPKYQSSRIDILRDVHQIALDRLK